MTAPNEMHDYYAHEALDRTSMVIDIVESHLAEHPYIQADPQLVDLINQATEALAKAYQHIGAKHL